MPSIAALSPMDALRFSFRTLVFAAVPPLRAPMGDTLAARATASAGLAAVLGLPILLLASLVLDAPLAVPAAIASGYLAISHALASNRPERAAFISGVVLAGLIGWLVLYLVGGEQPLTRTGLAAALMAPLFSAAPAFARSLMAPRAAIVASLVPLSHAAALERVACLEELAPFEQVLIADQEGCVLASTRAARRRLRLLPDAFEQPVTGLFDPADMPAVADALRRCGTRGEEVEISLQAVGLGEEKACATWMFSPYRGGAVSLRLVERVHAEPPISEPAAVSEGVAPTAPTDGAGELPFHICDLGEAVAFALRHARPRATARGIALASACERGLEIACDRQLGRRVARLAIEGALATNRTGGTIRVDARKLKGIVLMRVAVELTLDDVEIEARDSIELAMLRVLIDDAGGTLMVDRRGESLVLSVRLALAEGAITNGRTSERAEAA